MEGGAKSSSAALRVGVVEFHGFRGNSGDFIVKELVLVNVDAGFYTQVFFKPPYDRTVLDKQRRKQTEWLENNYHGIRWEYGELEYSLDTIKTLCSYFTTIYTKGLEKCRFLQQFHNNVHSIPDNAPKLSVYNDSVYCPAHPMLVKPVRCALQTALFYADWLRLHSDYTRESHRLQSFDYCANKLDLPAENIKEIAKCGFYYNTERNKVVCVWCNEIYDFHISCVNYYVQNTPIEFEVVIPRI